MSSSFFKRFYFIIILIFSVPLLINFFFIPTIASNENQEMFKNISYNINSTTQTYSMEISTTGFTWPLPGYRNISSPFGRRNSPTKGASYYHAGIDIPAPPGTNIFSAESGTVILAQFSGSGGCTVIVSSGSYQFTYCHVSPSFLVHQNQYVNKGELIAQVGPKNVYGFSNNPYKDSNGKPTNGATTGPHLHFAIKKDGQAVNPLNYF